LNVSLFVSITYTLALALSHSHIADSLRNMWGQPGRDGNRGRGAGHCRT